HAPLSGGGSATEVKLQPSNSTRDRHALNYFEVDEGGVQALGTHLIAGRNFRAQEILPPFSPSHPDFFVPEVILTRKTADALFPGQNALGKTLYDDERHASTVVGLIDDMLG